MKQTASAPTSSCYDGDLDLGRSPNPSPAFIKKTTVHCVRRRRWRREVASKTDQERVEEEMNKTMGSRWRVGKFRWRGCAGPPFFATSSLLDGSFHVHQFYACKRFPFILIQLQSRTCIKAASVCTTVSRSKPRLKPPTVSRRIGTGSSFTPLLLILESFAPNYSKLTKPEGATRWPSSR